MSEWAELSFQVPFDVARYSPNRRKRMCWQAQMRVADAAKEGATLAWLKAGGPRMTCPVSVDITIRRGRRLDPDALLACCKPLIDALFGGRVTPDDSDRWVSFGDVQQEIHPARRGLEVVEFRVRPRSPAPASVGGCAALLEEIEGEETP